MSTPFNVQNNSNPKIEKPINTKNDAESLEDVHLHVPIPIQNELAELWHHSEMRVKNMDTTSAIGPLGLLGFGLTTFLLNLSNAGVFSLAPAVLAMGICYGGLAQLICGILEWKKGNTFTSIAFISFGTFWWSYVSIFAIKKFEWLETESYENDFEKSMAWYLILWFVFTFIMFIASFTKPWAVRVIFGTLCVLFILLAVENWTENNKVKKAAGIVGMICAFSAIYSGAAEIINGAWLLTILPLGAPGEKWLGKISE